MNVILFCHSLLFDWDQGHAHFLRGLATELVARGHRVRSYEPADAWKVDCLAERTGGLHATELLRWYPALEVVRYLPEELDWEKTLEAVDLVLVHEWNEPALVQELGRRRKVGSSRFKLLFYDTHHRGVTDPAVMARYDLSGYDGVLASGEAVRQRYVQVGWARRAFTFHEAADVRVFYPRPSEGRERDLVWIGNWGDEQRTQELREFLLLPAAELGLTGTVHGVRYPDAAVSALREAGLCYAGGLPNYLVPEVLARHRATIHIPRQPYVTSLPGVPTIWVFEALACGIPLLSAPWRDVEGLFREGDFWLVKDGRAMKDALRTVLHDRAAAAAMAQRGRQAILARHTCAHRAEALCRIAEEVGVPPTRIHDAPESTHRESRA